VRVIELQTKLLQPVHHLGFDRSEAGRLHLLRFQDHHPHSDRPQRHAEAFLPVPDLRRSDHLYREDDGLRQLFLRDTFRYAERCRVHFERGNRELFDKESPSSHEGPVTPRGRLTDPNGAAAPMMAGSLAFSPDAGQQFLYVGDYDNGHVHIVNRRTLEVIGWVGRMGANPGEFRGLHMLATDSRGVPVDRRNPASSDRSRVQRLVFKDVS